MKKKKLMIPFVVCVFLTMNVILLSQSLRVKTRVSYASAGIEAMTDGEDWEGKKLAIVNCSCENSNKKGYSLRCRDESDYESCTQTQQGLNGCYSIRALPPSGNLLCEGANVSFDGE